MGMYYDYFRARDGKAAQAIIAAGWIGETEGVDFLTLKNFDAHVRIGLLLAFAQGTEWTVDTVQSTSVWPPEPAPRTPEDFHRLPDDSPWFTSDYHLDEFAEEFRDALASIGDLPFQRLEKEWTPTQEFDPYPRDEWLSDFRSVVDLAKRAQAANDKLFVRSPTG
jgi:hypothetical protein